MTSPQSERNAMSPDPGGAPENAPGTPPMRASDADRHATVHLLQEAVARGLLTFDEAGERMAAAYAARFAADLPPLTADLPRPASPGPAPGWRTLAAMLAEQLRAEFALLQAQGMRSPRARCAAVAGILLVVMFIAVAVLALHGLSAGDHPFHGDFGPRGGLGDR